MNIPTVLSVSTFPRVVTLPGSLTQTQQSAKEVPWHENTQSGIFRNRPTHCTCELNLRLIMILS